MAAVEDAARQAGEQAPEERSRKLAQSTQRRLVRLGAVAGTAGYVVPAMARVAAADSLSTISPLPVILTKTMAIVSNCEINGIITLINQTSKSLTIIEVKDYLADVSNQIVTFGVGTGDVCRIRLAGGATVPPGQCASVPYSIVFCSQTFATGTVLVNHAVVTYQVEGTEEAQQVDAEASVLY